MTSNNKMPKRQQLIWHYSLELALVVTIVVAYLDHIVHNKPNTSLAKSYQLFYRLHFLSCTFTLGQIVG